MLNIQRRPSQHFARGRAGQKPTAIVIHVIEGTLAAADSWFRAPESKVSAHYAVGKRGEIHQYVNEGDTAWHAGRIHNPTWAGIRPGINPNAYTIGIEHEGKADEVWPDAMYEASAELVADICRRWSIPCDRAHIVGHREIYGLKTCPGRGDVDRLVRMAGALLAARPRLLRLGSEGEDVRALQDRLGVAVTGKFDALTHTAVRLAQCRAGLPDDGIVGPLTRAALGL